MKIEFRDEISFKPYNLVIQSKYDSDRLWQVADYCKTSEVICVRNFGQELSKELCAKA